MKVLVAIICYMLAIFDLDVKESKQISLDSSDSTTAAADFKYSMQGKVISITYLGAGSIHKELGRILRKTEYWHQGSIKSFRILYQELLRPILPPKPLIYRSKQWDRAV